MGYSANIEWWKRRWESILDNIIWVLFTSFLTVIGLGVWIFYDFFNSEITTNTWVFFLPFLIGLSCGLFILFFEKGFIKNRFKRYTQDEFYNIVWLWKWNSRGEVIQRSITPLCPECHSELYFSDINSKNKSFVMCRLGEGCSQREIIEMSSSVDYIKEELKYRIEGNVRRKDY